MVLLEIRTIPRFCVNCLTSDLVEGLGVELSETRFEQFGAETNAILIALASLAFSIPANMFSQWLFNKLVKEKPQKLYINENDVPLQEPDIRRIVQQEIERQKKGSEEHDTKNPQC